MPYTANQWLLATGRTDAAMQDARRLIQAWQTQKVNPVGLKEDDPKYQIDMLSPQRAAILADFKVLVNAVITDLQTGLVGL